MNVVSGNAASGIRIALGDSTVVGNVIGMDASGRTVLGNEGSGIELDNARVTIVNNTISGNGSAVSADLHPQRSTSKAIASVLTNRAHCQPAMPSVWR